MYVNFTFNIKLLKQMYMLQKYLHSRVNIIKYQRGKTKVIKH